MKTPFVWPRSHTIAMREREKSTPTNSITGTIMEPANLPVSQLESLRFKVNQTIESIQGLQWILEANGLNVMPSWPIILSKYNILLSQTHSLSNTLASTFTKSNANIFENLALHPTVGMTDVQFDNGLIPFLRNLQTTEVLRMENETVRRMSEHMPGTKGSLGVLTGTSKSSYEDVLRECDQIKVEHDERVDRAVRAVTMLREKFDWKTRVEVEQEEPEELDWDPRVQQQTVARPVDEDLDDIDTPRESNDSEEEKELEDALGTASGTEETSPMPMAVDI
jgi:hypothetical protein